MRVFFDTNILVSSEVLLSELRDALSRKGRQPPAQIGAIETFLRDQPIAPRPGPTLRIGLVDGDDEWMLASAVLAETDLFVTGDQGFLACPTPPLPPKGRC